MSEAAALHPQQPALAQLLDWWRQRRGAAPFPPRAVVDPMDLRFVLGRLLLVEVVGPGRYRFRLYGTGIAQDFGFDLTGRSLDDMPDATYRELARRSYDWVVRQEKPLLTHRAAVVAHRAQNYEALLLPLGEAGRVTHILLGIVPLGPANLAGGKSGG